MNKSGPSPLVEAAWLIESSSLPGLVILDARIFRNPADSLHPYASGRTDFEHSGHPRRAVADRIEDFSDLDGRFLFTRPTEAGLHAVVQRLGIHADSQVVVYDCLNGTWAARVWWVLHAYGHQNTFLLDGGLRSWQQAGGALAFGTGAEPGGGTFKPAGQSGYFVNLPGVRTVADGADTARLVCASQRAEYSGEGGKAPRRGHIPGSSNLPYRELLDAGGRIDADRIRVQVRQLGLEPADRLILYCGGGINAAGAALALTQAGFDRPVIFDGSLNEWRADPALPLEVGS